MVEVRRNLAITRISSFLFSIGLGIAIGGLALSSILTLAEMQVGFVSTTLLLLLPVAWTSWIAFAILSDEKSHLEVYFLWVLIDLFALVLLNFITLSIAHGSGPRGDDVAFVIAYSPLIWPMLYLLSYGPSELGMAFGTTYTLVPKNWGILQDWFGMSILTALPSLLIITCSRFVQWKRWR
jgi:hypothetical protein